MPQNNRPTSHKKNVTSGGSGVHLHGSGLGTGPVGSQDGYQGKRPSGGSAGKRAAVGGGSGLVVVIIIVVVLMQFCGKGGGAGSLLGGMTGGLTGGESPYSYGEENTAGGGYTASSSGTADTSVAAGSRSKYTTIQGGGQDTVTMMVYMCGTDLESRSGMASSDLQEMAAATISDHVNVIVYTGGCSGWKTSGISSKVNQIYQVSSGGVRCLVKDDGAKPMTDPNTLTAFIQYCAQNFPANRNELIFWDHGGGSVSGYGYDEKFKNQGSMDLGGIHRALKAGGVKFDFVGFDACLMATAETALMLDPYADYMIASEETEPGIGWYYTNWLTQLSRNPSASTLEIGKNIVDDFVAQCAKRCPGQQTTLSVIDLAEFAHTVPADLSAFSKSLSAQISSKDYKSISDARYQTREFAQSSKIDQIDLVHFAQNLGTPEGTALSKTLQSAIKYNRTSTNMSNAYGVSIYFPYKRTSYVDTACKTYDQIGMDADYSKCIRQFASLGVSGQAAAGGSTSPASSLLDLGSLLGSSGGSSDMIGSILGSFLSGSSDRQIEGLDSSNSSFLSDNPLSQEDTAEYISMNYFDPSALTWFNDGDRYCMTLSEQQWSLVHELDLNFFYDTGSGYADLGLDNIFSFDDKGNLVADTERTWLSVNGQPVAYYHTDTIETEESSVSLGYIPALLDGVRVQLQVSMDNQSDDPNPTIVGVVSDYRDGETQTIAKSLEALPEGSTLQFVCDFYDYEGNYQDSYLLGESMTVSGSPTLSYTDVGSGGVQLMYRFTDIYDQEYWSEPIALS